MDDEEHILTIGTAHLTSAGYSVLQEVSGEQAIEVLVPRHKSIDLVILGLSMPGMGGSKCLEEMLALDPEAKVITSSG